MTELHKRIDMIARKVAKTRFRALPYTNPEDVYQAAYIGALLACRKPEFRPDDPGSDWWLSRYAIQAVIAQEQPLNKATSRCPRSVVDRAYQGRTGPTQKLVPSTTPRALYTSYWGAFSTQVRTRLESQAHDQIDRRILEMRLETDMTLPEIGAVVGIPHEDVYKRFKRIRLWARKQDFMLEAYRDLTGKVYATKSRKSRNSRSTHS